MENTCDFQPQFPIRIWHSVLTYAFRRTHLCMQDALSHPVIQPGGIISPCFPRPVLVGQELSTTAVFSNALCVLTFLVIDVDCDSSFSL